MHVDVRVHACSFPGYGLTNDFCKKMNPLVSDMLWHERAKALGQEASPKTGENSRYFRRGMIDQQILSETGMYNI